MTKGTEMELEGELEQLGRGGQPLADIVGGVLAPSGLQVPSDDQAGAADWPREVLEEINRKLGIVQEDGSTSGSRPTTPHMPDISGTDSGDQQASEPPLPPPSLPDRRNSSERSGEHRTSSCLQVFSDSLDSSYKQISKNAKNMLDADGFFEPFNVEEGKKKAYYRCNMCDLPIYNKKKRFRTYHIILCPNVLNSTRAFYYYLCKGKDKPPLLEHTFYGMTVSIARRIEKKMVEEKEAENGKVVDITRIPRYGQYVIAQQKLNPKARIMYCSEEEQNNATSLLLELVIEENLPFAICDRKGRHPRALARLLGYLRPGYEMPLGYKIGGALLDQFYEDTVADVKIRLKSMLQDCRATLMFDGSEDVNGAPMVNVLLRVMGSARMDTTTFFLSTVYTGYDTVDANYYVRVSEKIISEFVTFDEIAGIVTDNTGSVKNAREIIEKNYGRVVSSQDQAHVADRLMADIGEIAWVKNTIGMLAKITTDIRRFRKLRARLIVLMKEHNERVQRGDAVVNNELDSGEDETAEGDEGGLPEREDSEGEEGEAVTQTGEGATAVQEENLGMANQSINNRSSQGGAHVLPGFEEEYFSMSDVVLPVYDSYSGDEEDNSDCDSDCDSDAEPNERHNEIEENLAARDASSSEEASCYRSSRRARTMKKLSNVRFASSEKLLDEYISLRPVLLRLIDDPLFPSLYKTKNQSERENRERQFVAPIRSEELAQRVKQLHAVFHGCRTYLRIFDAETCMASEVFEATRILEETLKKLPLDFFPEPKQANRTELLEVFANRKEGPFPNRKRVKIRLISDLHVAAALLDPYRSPVHEEHYMPAFRRHLEKYLSGIQCQDLGIQPGDWNEFVEEMIVNYLNVRSIWRQRGFLQELSESSNSGGTSGPSAKRRQNRSPISWWTSGSISKPRDTFERKAVEELIEFARRTLSVSPTATATERTFSLEGRIHGKNRASLSPRKVNKLLFCQWNSRILRELALRSDVDHDSRAELETRNIRKLRHFRAAVDKARVSQQSRTSSAHVDVVEDNSNRVTTNAPTPELEPEPRNDKAPPEGGQTLPSKERVHNNFASQTRNAGISPEIPQGNFETPSNRQQNTVVERVSPAAGPRNVGLPQQGLFNVQYPSVYPPGYPNNMLFPMQMVMPGPPTHLLAHPDNPSTWVQTIHTTMASYSGSGTTQPLSQNPIGQTDSRSGEQEQAGPRPMGGSGIQGASPPHANDVNLLRKANRGRPSRSMRGNDRDDPQAKRRRVDTEE